MELPELHQYKVYLMNAILQMFTTIAMFFTATQRLISAVDHGAAMLDETAETAHKELTANNKDRIDALNVRLAAKANKRVKPATKA